VGDKSAPTAPAPVRVPSPEEIAAQQVESARGVLDLQLEKFPEFTAAEITRLNALAPATARAIGQAQGVLRGQLETSFPRFFDVLEGLGNEALSRLENIGEIPRGVLDQTLETIRAEQALRGITDSPIAVAGTAGQIAALGQNQRQQDINLANLFLRGPFSPTGLPGLPASSVTASTPSILQGVPIPSLRDVTGTFDLSSDIAFSNLALQRSNSILGGDEGGGFDTGGAISGGLSGAATGASVGSIVPGIGTGIGALAGGILGAAGGGFF
jgi:hypothetical protein